MGVINEYVPGGSRYFSYYTTYSVSLDVPNDKHTYDVKMYIKKTGALGLSTINGNVEIRVSTTNNTDKISGSYSVNLSSMSINESRVILQGTIELSASYYIGSDYGHIRAAEDEATITSRQTSGTIDSWMRSTTVSIPQINVTPPAIGSKSISNIGQSSARLNYSFTAPYDCRLDVAYMKFGDSAYTYVNVFTTGYSSQSGYYDITGLSSYTQYYFKIKITCINGEVTEQQFSSSTRTLPKPITQITIPETYVNEGETVTITADVLPNDADIKNLVWSPITSSNFQVISQSASTITVKGIAKGDVTLTAAATDGSGVYDTEMLHVMRYATSILPNRETLRLVVGEEFQISHSIYPFGSTDTNITYVCSDTLGEIAVVDTSGVIEAIGIGTATITATLEREHLETDLTSTINVTVLAEPEWISPQLPQHLSFYWIEDFYNNQGILRAMLTDAGATVGTLTKPNTDSGNATKFYDMLSVFNDIEANIDTLHTAIVNLGGLDDTYYVSSVEWDGEITDFKSRLERWINWENQVYSYLYTLNIEEE